MEAHRFPSTKNIGPKRPRLACFASTVNRLVACFASLSERQKRQRYFKAILLHAEVDIFRTFFRYNCLLHISINYTENVTDLYEHAQTVDIRRSSPIFQAPGYEANQYTVSFNIPSCSCPDWMQHHYPCKHFFAIFRLHPQWDWNALPQMYLASPRLSLDTDALSTYFSDDFSIKVGEPTQDGDMGMGIHQAHAQEDDSTELDFHSAEIPKRKVSTS